MSRKNKILENIPRFFLNDKYSVGHYKNCSLCAGIFNLSGSSMQLDLGHGWSVNARPKSSSSNIFIDNDRQ